MPPAISTNERHRRLRYRCHVCREKGPPLGEIMAGGTGWKCFRIPGWTVPQWFCGSGTCPHPEGSEEAQPKGIPKPGAKVAFGDVPRRRALVFLTPEETGHHLWGYGHIALAAAAGVNVRTANRAISAESLDPLNLLEVAKWIIERRIYKERPAEAEEERGVLAWVKTLREKIEPQRQRVYTGETIQLHATGGRQMTLEATLAGFDAIGFTEAKACDDGDETHIMVHRDRLTLRSASVVLDYMRAKGKRAISVPCVRSLVIFGKPYTDRTRAVKIRNEIMARLRAFELGEVKPTPSGIKVGGVVLTRDRAAHLAGVLESSKTARARIMAALGTIAADAKTFGQAARANAAAKKKAAEKRRKAAEKVSAKLEKSRAEATTPAGATASPA